MNALRAKLVEFGFSDKEANVYLAMLELGPASVIDIAKKADVNRATTYVMIESLKRRGLMSSVEQGKRTLFAAESPSHLLQITKGEMQAAETRHKSLEALMPEFTALFHAVEDKPRVRFFEGEEGLAAGREAMVELMKKVPQADVFIHYDVTMERLAVRDEAIRRKISYEIGEIRLLYTIDEGIQLPSFARSVVVRRASSALPFRGEANISDGVIMLAEVDPRPIMVIIESRDVARLFRSLFEIAWNASEAMH